MLSSALFAGLIAGAVAALLQFVFVIPALLEGELYEGGERLHFLVDGSTQSERGAPGLGTKWGRHAMTVAFNMVTYTGYGLILAAAMVFARDKGVAKVSAKAGLIWGLAGFIAVQLAPAVGLPPELPGTPAAELAPRQIWWISTIVATAVALAMIAFARSGIWQIAGGILLILPHLIGAPHLDTYFGIAPPELSAEFVTLSLGMAAIGWATLGYFAAFFIERGES
ncbi:CbtA family protein [Cognatishimia sp. WU-CL00825]